MKYLEIQKKYREQFNVTVKTCWIADVKRELGLITRIAHNRINKDKVKYPCPEAIKKRLIKIITDSKK